MLLQNNKIKERPPNDGAKSTYISNETLDLKKEIEDKKSIGNILKNLGAFLLHQVAYHFWWIVGLMVVFILGVIFVGKKI